MVNQQIYLPMIPDSAPIVVNISQNDFDAAGYAGRLFFNLINNGVAYDMDGATAIFQGEKPDGTSFAYPATVVNDSVVRVNVRQQMTVVSGRVVCQLVLNNTDGQIGSFNIWLEVQPSGAAGGDPSQTDIPALIAQAHEYADQAEQSAINAAAWSANPPYIGANGNWFVYDADTEAYVDTGVYASGTEGSLWYTGTAVNGKDVNPRVFPTGITTAREHDMYLNKTEGAIYQCTLGGPDSTAKWAYVMTLSGGGGGASDYPDLGMKPEINGHTLQGGNQTGASLGLQNTLVTGDGIDITGSTISAKLSAGTNVSLATQPDGTIEISAAGGGGGMLPYLYIDSEASATVTVNQPDSTVITPTAAGSGHWECELTGGYGTYVIHSVLAGQGDATQSLVVDTVMEYHVTDTHYDHTVSFVAPSGSTVRIEGGTEIYTLTGTGSTQTQAVHSASTSFTVTATMDGNGKPYTFTTPSTTGQTTTIPSGTFDFGTINVSVAADFVTAGSTITCVNGGTSCTPKTAASTLVFRVPTTGTWTISGSVSGQTYTTTATVTALGTPVSTSLQTVPDGSTVLPTDDIQTWLNCAGIYDKTSYTALADVLADSTTLLALMSDNNAVDYLVRSKSWITSELVPTMTSDILPKGIAFAKTEASDGEAFKAFDNDSTTVAKSPTLESVAGWFLGYIFDTPKKPTSLVCKGETGYQITWKVQVSNDTTTGSDGTWSDLPNSTFNTSTSIGEVTVPLNLSTAVKAIRIISTAVGGTTYFSISKLQFNETSLVADSTAMTDIGANNYCADTLLDDADWLDAICNSTYFESVLNVKVPTLSSDSGSDGGTASGSNSTTAWRAFDNDDATIATASPATLIRWIQYEFALNVNIKKYSFNVPYNPAETATLQLSYSDDGSTFTDVGSPETYLDSQNGTLVTYVSNGNSTKHKYWRLTSTTLQERGNIAKTAQFYGRKDV